MKIENSPLKNQADGQPRFSLCIVPAIIVKAFGYFF